MIPDYQSIMLPLLKQVADGKEYKFRELIELLALHFKLSADERKEMLASGIQAVFDNRVGWAKTYLKKAGLLDSPKRASIIISRRGLDVLKGNPEFINVKFLRQFQEFLEFQQKRNEDAQNVDMEDGNEDGNDAGTETPNEIIDAVYKKLRKSLAEELLTKIMEQPPVFFERLVVELLVKMGYGGSIQDAGKAIGRSGDEGVDGIIKEDKLGLDLIYVQAKRWQPGTSIGRPEIQKFVGALAGQGAKKGIFISTTGFTKDAWDYSPKNETKIVLIDGEMLAQLMIDHELGVTIQQTYQLKKVDADYFGEE